MMVAIDEADVPLILEGAYDLWDHAVRVLGEEGEDAAAWREFADAWGRLIDAIERQFPKASS